MVYGPPGFGENPDLEKKSTIYVLKLLKKINVLIDKKNIGKTDSLVDFNEYDISEVQLANLNTVEKYIDSTVFIRGTLYHRINGNHFTDVLLYIDSIDFSTK